MAQFPVDEGLFKNNSLTVEVGLAFAASSVAILSNRPDDASTTPAWEATSRMIGAAFG